MLFAALVQNETLKLLRRRRFAIVLGILFVILTLVSYSQYRQLRQMKNANWRADLQERIARARLAGEPPDVLLRPNVSGFTWLDFHRAREAVAEGVACVQASEFVIRRACRDAIPRA